jgi:hypothetical protein
VLANEVETSIQRRFEDFVLMTAPERILAPCD